LPRFFGELAIEPARVSTSLIADPTGAKKILHELSVVTPS
jgi:hypothetical protein